MEVVAFVVGTLLAVTVLAAGARGLLGVRVGVLRTLAAGGAGLVAQTVLATSIRPVANHWVFLSIQIGLALLVAMAVLVIAEVVLPSGSGTEVVRALRTRVTRTGRYLQIARIVVRHGLAPHLRGGRRRGTDGAPGPHRLARSVRAALEEGGVTFVKLGQLVATRADALPPEFVTELSTLHSQVRPLPWPDIAEVIRSETGVAPDELFAEIDPQPLAAAAVAQVHRARLRCGGDVVVKVQRPGVLAVVQRDLDIIRRIAGTLEQRTRWGREMGLVELAEGFATALREELDFRVEARNTEAVAGTGSAQDVVLPTLHTDLCTRRMLVLARFDGVPLGAAGPQLQAMGPLRRQLADDLLVTVLRQIMVDGVFHADPHPGNVMLLRDGRLALIDFGSVGRLDGSVRTGLQSMLLAMDRSDPAALKDALLDIVTSRSEVDERRLERALGQFMAANLGAGHAADSTMLGALLVLASEFGLTVPPEVAAVFRSMITLDGTLTLISPGFDLIDECRRVADEEMSAQLNIGALTRTAGDGLVGMLPALRKLPRSLARITEALEQGRMTVSVRLLADERDRLVVTGLVHLVMTGFVGATTGAMGVLLLGNTIAPAGDGVPLLHVVGYNLLVVSFVLVLRVLFVMLRRPAR